MGDRTPYIGQLREFNLYYSDWSIYKAHLDNYFIANNITSSDRKRAILLTLLNEEAYKLMLSLCQPCLPEDKDYEALITVFDRNLTPPKSLFIERYKFYKARRHRSESVEDWAMRVRNMAARCEFGDCLDECLRDKFIFGLGEEHLFQFVESDVSLSFEQAVKIVKEKVGSDHCDFRWYCPFGYRFHDTGNFFYDSDWSLFYPYVAMDCYRHYH